MCYKGGIHGTELHAGNDVSFADHCFISQGNLAVIRGASAASITYQHILLTSPNVHMSFPAIPPQIFDRFSV